MNITDATFVEVTQHTNSLFKELFTRVSKQLGRMKKSEIAEAMIATWCIEFLRIRKVGGFNVVEIVVVSVLMMGVKAIIMEASRRRSNVRSYTMSVRTTPMDSMGIDKHTADSHWWARRYERYRKYRSKSVHKKL